MGGGPGPIDKSIKLYKTLLKAEQPFFSNILFRDDRFKSTYEKFRNENEAKVI
jgi:hypothetical protein